MKLGFGGFCIAILLLMGHHAGAWKADMLLALVYEAGRGGITAGHNFAERQRPAQFPGIVPPDRLGPAQ